jgi:DMSO/TMAO reductase YedYZ molybdopterin-dependent catalytic subunit
VNTVAQTLSEVSEAARIAEVGEGISMAELALAARNHGMPLEALRYDVTPPGLHYLLTHYDIPAIDPSAWRLTISGQVRNPLELDLATLRRFEARTVRVTMECAGNGRAGLEPRPVSQPWLVEAVGTADWTGVPLAMVLDAAGADPAAVDVVFTGADHGVERGVEQDYQRSLPLAAARDPEVLLAYAMNGADLPPQHGHPVRLIVPGWYGMAHVKWLTTIELLDHAFTGFQQSVAYRLRQQPDEDGTPVTRIRPRALVIPPGFPDFMSRRRVVRPGPVQLEGRAWSGDSPIEAVEVSVDGGQEWRPATLEPSDHRWAWRRWRLGWTVTPGAYVVTARARTADGTVQPRDPAWSRGGFSNNAAQQVEVVCAPS